MDDLVRAFLENEQQLRLIKRLGRGGFAEVWEVEAPSGVRSAVKVSLDPLDGQSPAVQKELENLKLIRALAGHPHLVTLIDYWVVADHLVTRWELATDGDLLQLCERYREEGKPGIPFKELIKLMDEAADGLDFLHQQGIYHRDIKPQNLLLFHGHVKIGDLGLAKLVGASTASHTGSGTFGYLPPEAWEEHRLSPTVDLYALAATYIRLRTGREPFGTNPVEIVERQKKGEPILEGLEAGEAQFVRAALACKAEDRPQRGVRNWVRSLYSALRGQRPSSLATGSGEPVVGRSETQLKHEIVVDPSGGGDVRTLAEAMERIAEWRDDSAGGGDALVRPAAQDYKASEPCRCRAGYNPGCL
jgi:serine/threonine protein kinase